MARFDIDVGLGMARHGDHVPAHSLYPRDFQPHHAANGSEAEEHRLHLRCHHELGSNYLGRKHTVHI